MNLYEIDEKILECIDMETGELIDAEMLDQLQFEKAYKIENICLWIKNLKAEIEALKAEKQAFDERIKRATSKSESLKKYITTYLNGTKFESAKVQVSFRKSESLEISEDATIPEAYLKFKEPDVDKVRLKKAIKDGQAFEGISIVEKQNIQIK